MLLFLLSVITITTSAALTLNGETNIDLIVSQFLNKEKHAGFSSQQHLGSIHFIPNVAPIRKSGDDLSAITRVFPDTTTRADTSLAAEEESIRAYEEAVRNQEKARQRLQDAEREHQDAIREHQEALRQYRDALRLHQEYKLRNQREAMEEYHKQLRRKIPSDSLRDKKMYDWIPETDFFFDFYPDNYHFTYPADSLFTDSLPGLFNYFDNPLNEKERQKLMEEMERIHQDLILPDIYYDIPDLKDLPELYLAPLPRIPDLEDQYIVSHRHHMEKTESIIKNELLKDEIIAKGEECVVYIDSNMMSVNGVKQPREIFKKYKRLLETAMGEEIREGYTYFY